VDRLAFTGAEVVPVVLVAVVFGGAGVVLVLLAMVVRRRGRSRPKKVVV
jgi:hypothetical protein